MIEKIIERPFLFLGVLCAVLLILAFSAFNFIPNGQLQIFATSISSLAFGVAFFAIGDAKKILAIKYIAIAIMVVAIFIIILTLAPLSINQ